MKNEVNEKGKGKLNRFPHSFANRKDELVLHLLVNNKKGKSYERMENFKFSTTILESFNNGMNTEDFNYNTKILSIPYTLNLKELVKDKKEKYLKVLSMNEEFIKENKSFSNRDKIISNMKVFREEVNKL